MARTPLFTVLRRSLRLAQHANVSGEPADSATDRWRDSMRMSRRTFVAGGTVVAAGLATGCAPASRRPSSATGGARADDEPIVIVGAGIAGLTCAYRLRAAGLPVRVMEGQSRTGGRMYSLRNHFADGQVCELGGELIDTGHTHIRALAGELNIGLNDLATDDPILDDTVWFVDGVRRTEADVVREFQPLARRIEAALAPLGSSPDPTAANPQGAVALDRMTLTQWFDQEGVSGWLRKLLDVAYTTEYGLEPDRQSALNFLLMIDSKAPPFHVFGDSDERFHVIGGNDRIVTTLADRVSASIETEMVLESVTRRADGRHTLSFRRGASSRTVIARHVVLALPFTLLRTVQLDVPMRAAKRRTINELGYGTNAKLMIGFSSRPWREQHRSNGSVVTDLPFQLSWETSRLQSGRAGILTNFSGGRHGVAVGDGTPAAQAAALLGDLERVFPGVTAARAGMTEARFHWPTNPWVRGSYASYLAGQRTTMRGLEGEAVETLHFAGEHCSFDAQGYMEGGCETGMRVAEQLLGQRSRR
ncbi:MAG: NAD(P)/FAD-dependent oxidoreductase [Gemmatimonadaceae bacterium]|nr:NAD(P)/FAD-dependent oxidoreductase [Gemmatimonadaceae bacterium]